MPAFKTPDKTQLYQSRFDHNLHAGLLLVTDSQLVDLGISHNNYFVQCSIHNRQARPLLAPIKTVEWRRSLSKPGAFYLDTQEAHKNDTNEVTPSAVVQYATTEALAAYTQAGAGVGGTLTADAVGILTVDGVDAVVNDIILVRHGADDEDNGIYKLTTAGTAGVAFILTRDTGHDADAEVTSGDWVPITAGTTLEGQGAVITTAGAITVDTTGVTWAMFDWDDLEVSFRADVGDSVGF